jgi:hypothetical protein
VYTTKKQLKKRKKVFGSSGGSKEACREECFVDEKTFL